MASPGSTLEKPELRPGLTRAQSQLPVSRVAGFAGVMTILAGTSRSVCLKVLYVLQAPDRDGHLRHFTKPVFLLLVMFVAMALAVPTYWIMQKVCKQTIQWRLKGAEIRMLWAMTMLDVAANVFFQTGLLFVSASYYQLLRCITVASGAALEVVLLGAPLRLYKWVGVALVMIGTALGSIPTFMQPQSTTQLAAVGMVLITCGTIVQSVQMILAQKIMRDHQTPPLLVSGIEGIFGVLVVLVLLPACQLLPGPDHGSLESTADSIAMLLNSKNLSVALGVLFLSMVPINIFLIIFTFSSSAVWATILGAFLPVMVWLADLELYRLSNGGLGQPWNDLDWIHLGALVVLLAAVTVYSGQLKLPWLGKAESQREGWEPAESRPLNPSPSPANTPSSSKSHRTANTADAIRLKGHFSTSPKLAPQYTVGFAGSPDRDPESQVTVRTPVLTSHLVQSDGQGIRGEHSGMYGTCAPR